MSGGIHMQTEKILYDLAKPFVLSGMYKDEKAALTDITLNYVRRKIDKYDEIIQSLMKKYGRNFDQFTKDIKNKASFEQEEDWMDWKSAIEMRQSWDNLYKMIMKNAG